MNIYISSLIKENLDEAVEIANDLNLNMEISNFAYPNALDDELDLTLNLFLKSLKNFKGKLSLHGAFFDLNPASKDPKIREITAYRYNQSLHIAEKLDIKTIIFHTGYNGLVKYPVYHKKFIEDQILFWREFIKRFEDRGIVIALENTYEDDPDVIASIIDNVNSDNLKACIDTGHVNINSSFSVDEWIEKLGKNLYHMHLHNNYGIYDEHNSILKGSLDFGEIMDALKKNNLKPNLAVEIFSSEPALESIELLNKLLN